MIGPISGFEETAAVAAWVRHLGGLARLEGFHAEGRSQFVRSASEPLPPAPPFGVPRVLAHDEAPSYLDYAPQEVQLALTWLCAYFGEARIIARDLDLLSALMFLTQAGVDREYAVERDPSGRYLIVSGLADRVPASGDLLLHTHQEGLALPSEPDLSKMEVEVAIGRRRSWMIYSAPPDEHQLGFIRWFAPRSFEISFWRDRLDRARGERRTSAQNFLVRTAPEASGDEFDVGFLEVKESSLQGETIGAWSYGPETHPDRNVQTFWREVLR